MLDVGCSADPPGCGCLAGDDEVDATENIVAIDHLRELRHHAVRRGRQVGQVGRGVDGCCDVHNELAAVAPYGPFC